MQTIIKSSMG